MIKNKIVVIDSGISSCYVGTHPIKIFSGMNFSGTGDKRMINDELGHGTSIVNIISTLHKENEFIILKIYDRSLQQDIEILIQALQYILDLDVRESIIHMSVGVDFYYEELNSICVEISKRNNILVAAYDNAGCISYPAAFDCVVGVEGNTLCTKTSDFVINMDSMVDVYAKGGNHRVLESDGTPAIRQGNSYSAAFVTGFLARSSMVEYSKECALGELDKASTFGGVFNKNENNYFDLKLKLSEAEKEKIKNIGVFPYNKETRTLVRYAKYLKYKLVEVFSCKYFRNVGMEIWDKDANEKYVIKNIDEDSLDNIDTLVIGHVTQLEFYIPGIKARILSKCLQKGINVYSLDTDLLSTYFKDFNVNNIFLRCPTIQKDIKKKNGKLFQISIPIIGVFGTSTNQGKFSLQIELKKELENRQYSVGFLATEPTGELFGADKIIPYGYEGVRNITDYEFIDLINTKLHEIELLNREIIITGAQSRAIPQSSMHLGVMAVKQLEYMLAIQPDAVLLCVNYNDDIEYILRTINVIENMVQTRVIGLVLFPLGYKNAWAMHKEKMEEIPYDKLVKIKEKLQAVIKRNVYISGREKQKICDNIIDFFRIEY